jgi:hypothetical protein
MTKKHQVGTLLRQNAPQSGKKSAAEQELWIAFCWQRHHTGPKKIK